MLEFNFNNIILNGLGIYSLGITRKDCILRVLQNNPAIESRSRFKFLTGSQGLVYPYNLFLLVGFGILAGIAVSQIKLSFGIPGHSIVKIMIPMAIGLSLAPVRSAGAIMGISGLVTALISQILTNSTGTGTGAYTSLVCTGVLMDLTLYFANTGWKLYSGLMVSGLIANMVALYVRSGFKSFFKINIIDFNTWYQTAAFTYPICGLLAGLLCALVVFKFRMPPNNNRVNIR